MTERHAALAEANTIAVVSGLPRSGTSLMMQMLVAGGVPAVSDGFRAPDDSNPRGYYELEAIRQLKDKPELLADAAGQCVKVIHMLVQHLPTTHRYKVVFMQRDIGEVLDSQSRMLQRDGKPGAKLPPDKLAAIFSKQRDGSVAWLISQDHIELLEVDHRELLTAPVAVAARVAEFVGGLDPDAMAGCVDASLYRSKN